MTKPPLSQINWPLLLGGVITLFGDSEGLAREIGRLLGDERLRNQLGERGAQAAEAYDGRSLWPRHAEVLERLAK